MADSRLHDVPLIDIAPFRIGDAESRGRVAAEIDRACREIGFFVITGHGISDTDLDAMRAVTRGFFGQPLARKLQIAPPRGQRAFVASALSAMKACPIR